MKKKITLCGSTKFKTAFEYLNRAMTLDGFVVYSVAFFTHADGDKLTDREKKKLDEVHKKKIDNSDGILVIDIDGYIGDSTASEIEYAKLKGKEVTRLSELKVLYGMTEWSIANRSNT